MFLVVVSRWNFTIYRNFQHPFSHKQIILKLIRAWPLRTCLREVVNWSALDWWDWLVQTLWAPNMRSCWEISTQTELDHKYTSACFLGLYLAIKPSWETITKNMGKPNQLLPAEWILRHQTFVSCISRGWLGGSVPNELNQTEALNSNNGRDQPRVASAL